MSDLSPSASPSRRTVLVGGALVGLGALTGVGAGLVRHSSSHAAPPHPEVLLAAAHAERVLIAQLDAAVRAHSAPVATLQQMRADHAAHLAALAAAVAVATGAASTSPAPGAQPPPTAPNVARLREAETGAASEAARRAMLLTGRDAVLLASIAACEASHAELLA